MTSTTPPDLAGAFAELKSAMAQRDRARINAMLAAIVAQRPRLGSQWRALATLAQHHGEVVLTRRMARLWIEDAPGDTAVGVAAAGIVAQSGALDQADAIIAGLRGGSAEPIAQRYFRAMLATNLGRSDEARALLRDVVDRQPASGQAWLALATLGRLAEDEGAGLERARRAAAAAPPLEHAQYLYALGRWRDQQGDHAAAFAAIAQGAALARTQQSYDPALDRRDAAEATAGWNAEALRRDGAASPGDPIFVTGLPRSGTTLVEQILASHSAVGGGEELGLMRILEGDVGGKSASAYDRFVRSSGSADRLAALYRRLRRERAPDHRAFVDKTLSASRHVGLIRQVFPAAPIVWLRRDPLHVAWSAFRTWFSRGLNWSWSLADIAAHMRLEDLLFEQWRDLLGDRLLVVDYEALVRDPATAIARIDAYCGLTLEPQQLAPHETSRTVTTASVAQVRRPINREGLGAAAPYREHLQPFIAAYAAAGGTID